MIAECGVKLHASLAELTVCVQLQALVNGDGHELLMRGLTNITSVSTVEDSGFTNLKKSERLLVASAQNNKLPLLRGVSAVVCARPVTSFDFPLSLMACSHTHNVKHEQLMLCTQRALNKS